MQPLPRKTLAKHIQRLLTRWPSDPVRPSSVSVQTYLQSRLVPPPAAIEQKPGLFSSLFSSKKPTPKTQEVKEAPPPLLSPSNVDALYSLLENRYQSAHGLPRALRYPASRPEHYDVLLREFEEAPGRNWVGRVQKRVAGMLRMK